jgi:hypothetical protein
MLLLGKNWPEVPKLTDVERAEGNRLYDACEAASRARAEKHATKLERLARQLGRYVALGELTLEEATRRVDAIAYALDPTVPVPLGILVHEVAREMAATAFAAGVNDARKGGARCWVNN